MAEFSANITVMIKAVRKASRAIVRDFGEVENLQVSEKAPKDFVTAADLKSEKILMEELSDARPNYGFLVEESGETKGSDDEYRWIIDPLDGTTNFIHGIPSYCINIALERTLPSGKKEIVSAITAAPSQKEIFWAEKGCGAWVEHEQLGRQRLRVSGRKKLGQSLALTGSIRRKNPESIQKIGAIVNELAGFRCIGSTALSLASVAAGRGDIFFQKGTMPWDVASGVLLIREAGGYVSDITGRDKILESGSIIAANETLHLQMQKLLAE